jgi:hypothetical protein
MNNVRGFNCTSCGDTVYSRCKEDNLGFCHCGRVQVKGTPQEPEVYINDVMLLVPNLIDIELPVDNDILYWDWNLMRNDYGYISELPKENFENKIHEYSTS